MRLEAGLLLPPDHPARAQCIDADDSPLTPSRIEIIDDEVDEDKDDGLLPQSVEVTEQAGEIELQ